MSGTGDAEYFREAIIGASLELGHAHGEDGVTMRAIASRLGTSATTLYTCFESKAAIMRELRLHGVMLLGRSLIEGFELGDARECLLEVSRRYIAFARDNTWLYTVLFLHETPVAEAVTSAQAELIARLEVELTGRFLERFIEFSGRRPPDARRILVRWWAGLHGLAALLITRRVQAEHRFLPVGNVDTFIEEYVRGMVDGLSRADPPLHPMTTGQG